MLVTLLVLVTISIVAFYSLQGADPGYITPSISEEFMARDKMHLLVDPDPEGEE